MPLQFDNPSSNVDPIKRWCQLLQHHPFTHHMYSTDLYRPRQPAAMDRLLLSPRALSTFPVG